jgi:integrase
MGSLYRKHRRQPDGTSRTERVWWAKYYVNGRPVRESTGTDQVKRAERFLKAREGAVATGQRILPRADRVRYEAAAAALREHYRATGERDLEEAEWRFAHLDRFFMGRRLASLGPADATTYAATRQGQGAANATINRELAVLGRMLRLAYEHGTLLRLPILRKLKEAAPREGFFEPAAYQAVRRRLAEDLQVAVTVAYTYGWRMRSEVLALARRQVDLEAGTLRLEPGSTKNDDGRLVYLTPELKGLLVAHIERVKGLERRLGRILPMLFPHFTGRRAGTPRREFRKAWATACTAAGCPGMLRHDFRRTAVRNLERSGVPRSVAMKITGHRTEAVYRRYAIVSDADLQAATQRLAGTISGTSVGRAVDSGPVSV